MGWLRIRPFLHRVYAHERRNRPDIRPSTRSSGRPCPLRDWQRHLWRGEQHVDAHRWPDHPRPWRRWNTVLVRYHRRRPSHATGTRPICGPFWTVRVSLLQLFVTMRKLTNASRRTWSIAGVIGPVVGGSLANEGQWRWLFCTFPATVISILSSDIVQRRPQSSYLWRRCNFYSTVLEAPYASGNVHREAESSRLDVRPITYACILRHSRLFPVVTRSLLEARPPYLSRSHGEECWRLGVRPKSSFHWS